MCYDTGIQINGTDFTVATDAVDLAWDAVQFKVICVTVLTYARSSTWCRLQSESFCCCTSVCSLTCASDCEQSNLLYYRVVTLTCKFLVRCYRSSVAGRIITVITREPGGLKLLTLTQQRLIQRYQFLAAKSRALQVKLQLRWLTSKTSLDALMDSHSTLMTRYLTSLSSHSPTTNNIVQCNWWPVTWRKVCAYRALQSNTGEYFNEIKYQSSAFDLFLT